MMRAVLLLLPAILLAACSGDLAGPADDYETVMGEAWELYADAEFAAAASRFEDARVVASSAAESRVGRGWSLLRQEKLLAAREEFVLVPSSAGDAYADAQAGLTLAYDALDELDRSISAGQVVLRADSAYVFSHDARIDWRDICYCLAKNLLALSEQVDPSLARTLRYLNRIDGEQPRIDGAMPATWTAGGAVYGTAEEAILKRLERIQSDIME